MVLNSHKEVLSKYVNEGASLLDRVCPNWFRTIDLETLSIVNPHTCILAQVFGKYTTGLHHVSNGDGLVFSLSHCFNLENYLDEELAVQLWSDQITMRRQNRPLIVLGDWSEDYTPEPEH